MLSRFYLIPERYGQTDRQTDRFAISMSRVSTLTRDKKCIYCGQLILRKISKIGATRCQILMLKCTKFDSYSAPPDPYSWI